MTPKFTPTRRGACHNRWSEEWGHSIPRRPNGAFILKPGTYEMTVQSYCLHAGTYGPSRGNGYLYAPLKGPKQAIIQRILQDTWKQPGVSQNDVQMIIWAILARARLKDLAPELRRSADKLLSRQEQSELDGSALDWVPSQALDLATASLPGPSRSIVQAENELRRRLAIPGVSFQAMRQIAVLAGRAPRSSGPSVPMGRWSEHLGGFYVRYFPSSFMRTRVQVYVPALEKKNKTGGAGGSTDSYGDWDLSSDVATPGNPGSQRLATSPRDADAEAGGGTPVAAGGLRDMYNHPLRERRGRYGPYYFGSIQERSLYYEYADRKWGRPNGTCWFGAATLATGPDAGGRADMPNMLSDDAVAFLKEANEYLSYFNVNQFIRPLQDGEDIPGAEGLSGKDLDHRMVEIEQRHLQDFMGEYRKQFTPSYWSDLVAELGRPFRTGEAVKYNSNDAHRDAMKYALDGFSKDGKEYDFTFDRIEDRILLGDRLVDYVCGSE